MLARLWPSGVALGARTGEFVFVAEPRAVLVVDPLVKERDLLFATSQAND